MSILAKFIDSLQVHVYKATFREVVSPVFFNGTIEKHNILIMLNKGNLSVGKASEKIQEKSFYIFPSGQRIFAKHGVGEYHDLGPTGCIDDLKSDFLQTLNDSDHESKKEIYTLVAFDALIYNTIPLFEIMEMPPFAIPQDEELEFLIRHVAIENELEKLGREKIIRNYMEEILIYICRYIETKPEFKIHIDKLDFLNDRRLIDIVRYIRENLDKDLSNKAIANVAFISEDYVGQFFKSLTGKNLQDYIESQRLEKALFLLRTQQDNVQEIARKVGFKDPAYFSRRFKMKFGENANTIRNN